VRRRYQFFVALLSIALQATDLLLGGWGHRHDHLATRSVVVEAASKRVCGHVCSHHHHDATSESENQERIPSDSHDDCSLCRHFSQPVVVVAVEMPVVACERAEPLYTHFEIRACIGALIEHPARGPPASFA